MDFVFLYIEQYTVGTRRHRVDRWWRMELRKYFDERDEIPVAVFVPGPMAHTTRYGISQVDDYHLATYLTETRMVFAIRNSGIEEEEDQS